MVVSATAGSLALNCMHAPPLLLPGTGPFREEESEKNTAPAFGGHLRTASWRPFEFIRYLSNWISLSNA